jgi:hypothetical protein
VSFIRIEKQPALERQHTDARSTKRTLVIVAIVAVVLFAWTRGTFDNFLWRVHLNYTTCGTNGFGATFCGKDLDRYQQRLQKAGINTNP